MYVTRRHRAKFANRKRNITLGQITADSEPDYDAWGIDEYWSCTDWIEWHKALAAKYGREQANSIWSQAWDKQGAWEHNYSWCKYNCDWSKYLLSQGIDASWLLPKAFCGLSNIVTNTIGVGENVTGAAKTVSKVVTVALIAGGLYWGAKEIGLIKSKK